MPRIVVEGEPHILPLCDCAPDWRDGQAAHQLGCSFAAGMRAIYERLGVITLPWTQLLERPRDGRVRADGRFPLDSKGET